MPYLDPIDWTQRGWRRPRYCSSARSIDINCTGWSTGIIEFKCWQRSHWILNLGSNKLLFIVFISYCSFLSCVVIVFWWRFASLQYLVNYLHFFCFFLLILFDCIINILLTRFKHARRAFQTDGQTDTDKAGQIYDKYNELWLHSV